LLRGWRSGGSTIDVGAIPARPAAATTTTVAVLGTADIFAAGQREVPDFEGGGGTLPSKVGVGDHRTMKVTAVKGSVFCDASKMRGSSADGPCAGVNGPTDIASYQGISGILDKDSNDFLVGVFLGRKVPASPPPRLDFSDAKLGTAFTTLKPKLGQTFFIGNGRTASGARHRYAVPSGATRLFLGIADAAYFNGSPGYYGDNGGKWTVTVRLR
jgi:hypothetical protein